MLQSHGFNVFRGTDVTQACRSSFVETTQTKLGGTEVLRERFKNDLQVSVQGGLC